MSYYLTRVGREHIVLERGAVGERWRSERWDSMSMITPNFMIELPGADLGGRDPDGFMARGEFIDYLDYYAASFAAPVRGGIEVTRVETRPEGGFRLRSDTDEMTGDNVVVATGFFQEPSIPDFASRLPSSILQLHATGYRRPDQLPAGGVLIVGTGNSGVQIAREVQANGRQAYLSVGRHKRSGRWYRGRSSSRWSQAMGALETTVDAATPDALAYGAQIGYNVPALAEEGVILLGRLQGVEDGGALQLADDLEAVLAAADESERAWKTRIDRFIEEKGIDAPSDEDESASRAPLSAPTRLDLASAGIATVIWATGYRPNYGWIEASCFDDEGKPVHQRGVTSCAGLYFLGLRWQHKAKSFVVYGVAEDAAYLCEAILRRSGTLAAK